MSEELTGKTIAGRYRVLEVIGEGGFSTIYKAEDIHLLIPVALKVFRTELARDAEYYEEHFLREARTMARLNHPNIVRILDSGQDEGLRYLVSEFVEGCSLARILDEGKPLDLEYTIEIIGQVGTALSYVHSQGLVHRDIKPSNVLISKDGRVRLADFGLAIAPGESTLTRTGTVLGTAICMSPEQIKAQSVDARSDIYSLGVVLYWLLTGGPPFSSPTVIDQIEKTITQAPPPPRSINPAVPALVEQVVLKALAKDPQQRFQTVDDFVAALVRAGAASVSPSQPVRLAELVRASEAASASEPLALREPITTGVGRLLRSGPLLIDLSEVYLVRRGRYPKRVWKWALAVVLLAVVLLAVAFGSLSPMVFQVMLSLLLALFVALGITLGFWFSRRSYLTTINLHPEPAATSRQVMPPTESGGKRSESGDSLLEDILKSNLSGKRSESGDSLLEDILKSNLNDLQGFKSGDIPREVTAPMEPYSLPPVGAREVLAPETSAMAWLVVLNGPNRGHQFRLTDRVLIGRDSVCNVVLNDVKVSRFHAEICLEDNQFYIYDRQSANGTMVNGLSVARQKLRDRDEIRLSYTILLFVQAVSPKDLTVEAKQRLREFDSLWEQMTRSVRHD